MEDNIYKKQKELIIKQYGQPERDFDRTPLNESAKRIDQLNAVKLQAYNEDKQAKKLLRLSAKIKENKAFVVQVPEQLIRAEWLITFTEPQKLIITQWLKNTEQTPKQIADAIASTIPAVRTLMSLEAFKMLKAHLAQAYKELLPIPALARLRELLFSDNESVSKDIAKLVLMDAGLFKPEMAEATKTEKSMDAETEKKLKELADRMLGIDKAKE